MVLQVQKFNLIYEALNFLKWEATRVLTCSQTNVNDSVVVYKIAIQITCVFLSVGKDFCGHVNETRNDYVAAL